jgi:hypothetical protein
MRCGGNIPNCTGIWSLDRAIIDEIQRAPQLLLAIKKTVDEDRRLGRFLLTWSAIVCTAKKALASCILSFLSFLSHKVLYLIKIDA